MTPALVEVRDYYYRDKAGTLRTQRWIGDKCVSVGDAQVVILDWWSIKAAWTTLMLMKPCTALVKEGPKAMVVYGGELR